MPSETEADSAPSAAARATNTSDVHKIEGNVLDAIRMVLSGVARAHAKFPCGKNLIAQMLCGSNNAKIKKLRMNQLSTYGLLKHLKQEEVLSLIEALIILRCLEQVELEQFRPVLEITEFGVEVMKGHASLNGRLPIPEIVLQKIRGKEKTKEPKSSDHQQVSDSSPSIELNPNPEILLSLKNWRSEIADNAGVPRYCILSNDVLLELAHHRPKTLNQLLAIKGIGPVKVERYGRALLEILSHDRAGECDESKKGNTERETTVFTDVSLPPSTK
jgi:ATP-dependent DNA helicase RecQ